MKLIDLDNFFCKNSNICYSRALFSVLEEMLQCRQFFILKMLHLYKVLILISWKSCRKNILLETVESAMLATQMSAGVTPELNLKNPFHLSVQWYKWEIHPGFETQGKCPTKRTDVFATQIPLGPSFLKIHAPLSERSFFLIYSQPLCTFQCITHYYI